MRVSQRGVAFISAWEGWVDHVYVDQVGVKTIGFGHALKAGESFPARITRERGLELLARDLEFVEAALNAKGWTLTQAQFDALASWLFNCGAGALHGSTVERRIRAGEMHLVPGALAMWCKGRVNGQLTTIPGLLNRRHAEGTLWSSDDITDEAIATLCPNNGEQSIGVCVAAPAAADA